MRCGMEHAPFGHFGQFDPVTSRLAVHVVDSEMTSRAQQARTVFDLGHHAEVYSSLAELMDRPPHSGIVLLRAGKWGDVPGIVTRMEERGFWLPLVLTDPRPAPAQIVSAMQGGALGFLSLPLSSAELRETLRDVARQATQISEDKRNRIAARERLARLSPRERQVLDRLAAGQSNKEIARDLDISPRTVEIHRANMMLKLDAQHVASAVRIYLRAGEPDQPAISR
jgi:RNA polymerase sigma factor (sigma-70 family)